MAYIFTKWPRFSVVQETLRSQKVIIKKTKPGLKPRRVVAWEAKSKLDTLRRLYDPIGVTGSVDRRVYTGRDSSLISNPRVRPTPNLPKLRRIVPRESRLNALKRLYGRISIHRRIHPTRHLILAPWSMIPQ